MKHRKTFQKILKETQNFTSQKSSASKSTPVSSNGSIHDTTDKFH